MGTRIGTVFGALFLLAGGFASGWFVSNYFATPLPLALGLRAASSIESIAEHHRMMAQYKVSTETLKERLKLAEEAANRHEDRAEKYADQVVMLESEITTLEVTPETIEVAVNEIKEVIPTLPEPCEVPLERASDSLVKAMQAVKLRDQTIQALKGELAAKDRVISTLRSAVDLANQRADLAAETIKELNKKKIRWGPGVMVGYGSHINGQPGVIVGVGLTVSWG